VEPPLPVAGQDDRVLAHVSVEEIVAGGHQALVPDHQPGAPEDPGHLVVVDRLLAEDAAVDLAGGRIDDDVLPGGAHPALLLVALIIGRPARDVHRGFGAIIRDRTTLARRPRT
jgi:hypothetical protein